MLHTWMGDMDSGQRWYREHEILYFSGEQHHNFLVKNPDSIFGQVSVMERL